MRAHRWLPMLSSFVLALDAGAQAQAGRPQPGDALPASARVMRSAARTTSLEVLGQDVVSEALRIAAARPDAERARGTIVLVPITVRTFTRPHVPSPDEIDVCYETSSGLHDYIACSGPHIEITPIPPVTVCDDLWRQYRAATNLAIRRTLFLRLIVSDCIELATVRIEARRQP